MDFLGGEISAAGDEIVVVKMPDERRPGVVEHPLNDAGGDIFFCAVSFKHGAFAVVGAACALRS